MYLLDTNICIALLNGKKPALQARLLALPKADVVICSIVSAELRYGVYKSKNRIQNEQRLQVFLGEFKCLPFDDEAAKAYGLIRANLEALGTPIGSNDYMIAAIGLSQKLTVVTRNSSEFERISGLSLVVW